ncbi:quinone oxidoreductase family protein [Rugosimonospora africana]|uniref:Quinone oxidoreductase n=1 Tax=Rugosimonospora africana TaxID=556532 RepID=A0A8J3QQC9_9ACTN|nr:quinone oxidoreductase [Rugosimonospora africana]GIH14581.1 quinone oxidoreductase [Rugosimonospora africana]
MKAIEVNSHGGAEVLALAELADPVPGAGQLLVRLAACGVNYIDTYHRRGLYPRPLPFVPGTEGAGEVVAAGAGVDPAIVGRRVASADLAGAYAEFSLVNADRAVPLPDDLGDELGAAAMLQGMTAHYLVHDSYRVQPGDSVLVHAAAGGMGLLLTQYATALGARVIATASTPEKAELARTAGAAEVLGYDGFADAVRDLTGGEGVAAVYDGVGRSTFDGSLASLRRRGILVLYGQSSGPVPPFDPARLAAAGSLSLTRPTLTHFVVTADELNRRAGDVLRRVADGSLSLRIGARYPLAEARRAHEDLENRRTTGKLLLIP